MLHIRLLGDFYLELDGEPLRTVNTSRLQAVLAYLLLHRQAPQSRQHMAFQFWPDSSEGQALNNLRMALHELRHALPNPDNYLQIDGHTVQWRPLAPYTLDVSDFEECLAAAHTSDPAPILEKAVALYRGDLLPTCYYDWITPIRERLRQACITALERLAGLAEDRRAYPTAIGHTHHLLRCDPLHEAAHRRLMQLHALNGDRAAALQAYHTCANILRRELDVEPAEETQQAYARLLNQEVPAAGEAAPGAKSATQWRLVGRQPEWQALRAAWRKAAGGQAHFCLIQGEAGSGKTRLAEELLAWAERQGVATARTRLYAAKGGLAYAPAIDWLRSPALQPALAALDPVWLSELARLLPELLAEQPQLPRPEPLAESWRRQRLFEALARTFAAVPDDRGRVQPKLLFIDDLQWCDSETLAWLGYLLRFAPETGRPPPLLLLGTARPEEVDEVHPLTALLLDLRQTQQVTELALAPLSAAETAELAVQVTPKPLAANRTNQLYIQTEGNPLFVVETVLAGDWTATNATAGSKIPKQTPTAGHPAPPPKVLAVIQQRLARLTPAARRLAGLAATIGRSFTYAILAEAGDGTEDELVHSLDELWRRGIVRVQTTQAYDFSHDRIREAAYAAVSPVQRPLLHRRVAQAMERLHTSDLNPVSAQLAAHYEQAGLAPQAIRYYDRAAKTAASRYDYANAIELLDLGLHLLRSEPHTVDSAKQKLSMLVAKVPGFHAIEGFTGPLIAATYAEIEALLPEVDDARLQYHARNYLRDFKGVNANMAYALEEAERLLALALQFDDPALLMNAYRTCGITCVEVGRHREAKEYFIHAVALHRRADSAAPEIQTIYHEAPHLFSNYAFALWLSGYPEQAQACAAEALSLAERLGNPMQKSLALFYTSMACRYLNHVERITAQVKAMLALDRQYVIPVNRLNGLFAHGWVLAQQGELQKGAMQMRAVIDEYTRMNLSTHKPHLLAWLAEAQLQAGQWQAAAASLDEGMAVAGAIGQRSCDPELHRLRGELYMQADAASLQAIAPDAATDRQAAAEASFWQAIEIARTQEAKSLELRAVMSLCRLWQQQGRQAEARALLSDLYNWFSEGFDTHDLQEANSLLIDLAA